MPGRRPGVCWVLNWHVGQDESLTPEKSPSVLGARAQVCEDAMPRLRGFAGWGARFGCLLNSWIFSIRHSYRSMENLEANPTSTVYARM